MPLSSAAGPPRITRRALGGLALAAGLSAAGCAAGSSGSTYRFGVITSQTGSGSQLGVGELQGAQLAADTLNAGGGIRGRTIELITADDQSTPVQAVLQARRMIGNVDALIGPTLAASCNAVTPLAESSRTVTYCLSPGIKPKPGGYVWSASVSTRDLSERILRHWRSGGMTRIGLLHSTDASGEEGGASVHAAASALPGTEVVAEGSFEPGAVSVTAQLQAVLAARPQALVVWSTGAAAAVAIKAIAQLGLDLPVATTNGNLTYAFLRRIADYTPKTLLIPATQDFWWRQSDRPAPAPELEERYHRDFQARHGAQPDFGPGVAYDAVLLLADALTHGTGDRGTLKEDLERREVVGVAGTYRFRPDERRGLGVADVAMVRVANGGFVPVEER
ncbi:ABC transporter substrate-binding protein [Pseudonocardia acaciae]|uniref:ABC transporter substrate-binding protein n=1 Tax=Pseudonocardia acaciae TaxID=551276 RepID=UPI00048FCA75|nr:ABC transporter substrate-binding protein [Pseudonocardia acaciae]